MWPCFYHGKNSIFAISPTTTTNTYIQTQAFSEHSLKFQLLQVQSWVKKKKKLLQKTILSSSAPDIKDNSLFKLPPSSKLPVKGLEVLRVPVVYHVPGTCGQCYIGQTGCTIEICRMEHQQHWHLRHGGEMGPCCTCGGDRSWDPILGGDYALSIRSLEEWMVHEAWRVVVRSS